MLKVNKILVGEECDAFEIAIVTDEETITYRFLQEDSVAIMADMFRELGYDAEYQEVY